MGVVKSRWLKRDRQINHPSKLIIMIIEVRPPQMPIKEKLYTNVAVS